MAWEGFIEVPMLVLELVASGLGMTSAHLKMVLLNCLKHPEHLTGPVEQWLGEVERRMKASVRHQTQTSLLDYAVRPRPEWVRSWPAMAVLAVSAICWSQVCSTCPVCILQV